VLEQHRDAPDLARGQRVGKSAGYHDVARLVDFAKQTGVALNRAFGIDSGARRED